MCFFGRFFRLLSGCAIVAGCLLLCSAPCRAGEPEIGCIPEEKQVYELFWEMVPVGMATLRSEALTEIDSEPALHFSLRTKSNALLDPLYKVRNRIDAYTDTQMHHSLLYTEIEQGKDRKDKRIRFDWARGLARYQKNGKWKDPVPIRPGTFDPLSAFYFFRSRDLEPDSTLQIPVCDGKKTFLVKVAVLGREEISVAGELHPSYRLEPELTHFGGVFEESENPEMTLWVRAEPPHILLRLECRVIIGRVIAVLTAQE